MPHVVLSEVAAAIDIQTGAVVSRVNFHDDRTEVTVFGFDAGEGLSEHQASRSADRTVVSFNPMFHWTDNKIRVHVFTAPSPSPCPGSCAERRQKSAWP